MCKRFGIAVLTAAIFVSFASPAFADIRADARKYYQTGMKLLKSGKVDDGVEALEKAFSLMPHPNTLLTLARVFEQLKDWERSIHYYERYLEFDPIDKADVQDLISKMKLKLQPPAAPPTKADTTSDNASPAAPAAAPSAAPEAAPSKAPPPPKVSEEPRISASAVLREIALRLDRLAGMTESAPMKQDADQLVEIAKAIEKNDPQVPLAPKVDAEVLMRQRGCSSTQHSDSLMIFALIGILAALRLPRRARVL